MLLVEHLMNIRVFACMNFSRPAASQRGNYFILFNNSYSLEVGIFLNISNVLITLFITEFKKKNRLQK